MQRTAILRDRAVACLYAAGSFRVPVQCFSHGAPPPRGAVR
jgi:hypothetical protein